MLTLTGALSSHSPLAAAVAGGLRRFVRASAPLMRALVHRRDVHRLLELSDRELRDIGLVRGEVMGALDTPLGIDPSALLAVHVTEGRRRTRSS